jgi:hypothetical protein
MTFPMTAAGKPSTASLAVYCSNFVNASLNGVSRKRPVNPADFCQIGVTIAPGRMMITSIPNRISSRRRLSENPSKPNFDAAYAPVNGPAIRALVELTLTILPGVPFLAGSVPSSGRNAFVTMNGPSRLTSSWCRNCSVGRRARGPVTSIPALLTSPSSLLVCNIWLTLSASASTADSSVTSNRSGTNISPNSRCKRLASFVLRTLPNTRNPRLTRTLAAASPIPVETPVITTCFMD